MRQSYSVDSKLLSESEEIFQDAISRGEIYSPPFEPDDKYVINDPATEEGPEISEKLGGETTDDNDDTDGDRDGGDPTDTETTDDSPATSEGGDDSSENEDGSDGGDSSPTPDEAPAQTADADDSAADTDDAESPTEQSEPEADESPSETDDPQTSPSADSTDETPATSDDQDTTDEDDVPDEDATGGDDDTDTNESTGGETESETDPEPDDESDTNTTPTKTKQDYLDEGHTELEAEIAVDPPEGSRIKAAMAAAIEFFHSQLDVEIPENVEWNENNPEAPYRKPETPREYFQDPAHDDDPSEAVEFNEQTELVKKTLAADDGQAQYDISQRTADQITATTASNESIKNRSSDANESNESIKTDSSDADESNDSVKNRGGDGETIVLYNYRTRDNRGWSPETISEKKLGWAPRDTDSLREHLLDEGFTPKELMATGLFNDAGDGTLLPFMQARYIIPYFDSDGEPVFLISRSIDTDMERDRDSDFHRPTKYLKPKEAHIEEPIYGTQTIEDGKPLVITEGIADAITAHEHGIPCISPVTTQFKDKHYPILRDLIVSNDVPQVFIIQDADPPTTSVPERFTPEYAEAYDPETDDDKREPVEIDSLEDDAAERAITVNQKGPGFNGALKTALDLDEAARRRGADGRSVGEDPDIEQSSKTDTPSQIHTVAGEATPSAVADRESHRVHPEACGYETPDRAFETYLVELPRFGDIKYDLDDYLSDGMATVAPPAMWAGDHIDRLTPTTDWVTNLHLDGELDYTDPQRYVGAPAVGGLTVESDTETSSSQGVPLDAMALNYLPTITPDKTALSVSVEAPYLDSPSGVSSSDLPSMDGGSSSDADMWELTWREVFGLDEGYRGKSPFGHIGESENYFVVITPTKAYCHKRKVTYTPSTGVLVEEGERFPEDPEGPLTGWEKFVYWAHLREKGIVDDKPPNEALLAYARKHDLASDGDGIETRDGEYGEFDALSKESLYTVLDSIESEYAIEVTWDPYGDRHTESDTNDDSTAADGERAAADSGGSRERADSDEPVSAESESGPTTDAPTTDDAETDPAVDEFLSEDDASAASEDDTTATDSRDTTATSQEDLDSSADDSTGDSAGGFSEIASGPQADDEETDPIKERRKQNRGDLGEREADLDVDEGLSFDEIVEATESNDPHEKFRTYDGPTGTEEGGDDDSEEVDVDREAVKQFVEDFATVDDSRTKELKDHKKTLYDAFKTWAKINSINLDKLSEDVYINHRIGNFKNILENEYGLNESKYTVRDERKKGFAGIKLSDNGYELAELDLD